MKTKHLEYAFDQKNQIWRYIVLLVLAYLLMNFFAAILILIVTLIYSFSTGKTIDTSFLTGGDLFASGVDQNLILGIMMFVSVVGLVVFALLLKAMHDRNLKGIINGRSQVRWKRVFLGFAVWGLLILLSMLISYLINPDNFVFQFNWKNFLPLILITLLFIPFQTTFEEVTLRGYLMQGLATKTGSRFWSMIIVAVIFALLHVANPEVKEFGFLQAMPSYLAVGLVLGIVSVLDDGIELAMGYHAANNMLLALLTTHEASAFQTPAIFKIVEISPLYDFIEVVVFGIVFIFILQKKYKWNWNLFRQKVVPPESLTIVSVEEDILS